jgi:hypothetical protein
MLTHLFYHRDGATPLSQEGIDAVGGVRAVRVCRCVRLSRSELTPFSDVPHPRVGHLPDANLLTSRTNDPSKHLLRQFRIPV